MPEPTVRILNFDDSVVKQENLLKGFNPEITDFKAIGPPFRIFVSHRIGDKFKKLLSPRQMHLPTFLGSGDFHHISSFLIEQFEDPLSVIVFDHHPDWDIIQPILSCGSWVTRILKKANIKKVVLLGISSSDISSVSIQTGNLRSLKNDRVEIYPYEHKSTFTMLKDVPKSISLDIERGIFRKKINWKELKGKDMAEFFVSVLKRIPTKDVYLSIDKDCLKSAYALTNWEEGNFELDELLTILKLIKENLNIVGMDVVGDYSEPLTKGFFRQVISYFDHPKNFSAKGREESFITSINEKTNLEILKLLIK